MLFRSIKPVTLLFIFFIANYSFAQDSQEIIKKVQSTYENITDAKAVFSQTLKGSGGRASSSSGTIYIKKNNKYRIETGGQIIITDGQTSWSYSPRKKQVIIDNYKEDGNTFSPNKFLFNYLFFKINLIMYDYFLILVIFVYGLFARYSLFHIC